MRRWIIGCAAVFVLMIVSFYVLIPTRISIRSTTTINASQRAIRRLLLEDTGWTNGWAAAIGDKSRLAGRTLRYNGYEYTLIDKKYSSLLISVHNGKDSFANTSLDILELEKGVMRFDWHASVPSSVNPLLRLWTYRRSKKVEKDLDHLLVEMKQFYSNPVNVYGLAIRQEPVLDTTLLFVYDSCRGLPGTPFIYGLVDKLQNYVQAQHARATGYPMLNVSTNDSVFYLAKVALPVDRKLPANGKMQYKWMLPHGNILVADVKGGPQAISQAFAEIDHFVKDFGRDAPAIPFVSLVTDRRREPDSTKWISRIYYPVME